MGSPGPKDPVDGGSEPPASVGAGGGIAAGGSGHPPVREMWQQISGFLSTQAIYVAAKLDLAELVGEGLSADELARLTSSDPAALYRILRFLASIGVFAEDGHGYFTPTELSDCLRRDSPDSLHDFALFIGELAYPAFAEVLYAVGNGTPPFDHVFGASLFDYLTTNPTAGKQFNRAMAAVARLRTLPLLGYDWDAIRSVVDVGGGSGAVLIEVMKSNLHLHGTIFDQPELATEAAALIHDAGVAERCRFVGGDFFDAVPSGADAYLLSAVLHDWDDDQAQGILAACRKAMTPRSRLLLVEYVLPTGNVPHPGKVTDMIMLALNPGHERTEPEWRTLLERTDFDLSRIHHSDRVSLIEALPRDL
jgi:predicted O-methyltransferase YrrM